MDQDHPAESPHSKPPKDNIQVLVSLGSGPRPNDKTQDDTSAEHSGQYDGSRPSFQHRFDVEEHKTLEIDKQKMVTPQGHDFIFTEIPDYVNGYLEDSTIHDQMQDLAKKLVEHRRQKCVDPKCYSLYYTGSRRAADGNRFGKKNASKRAKPPPVSMPNPENQPPIMVRNPLAGANLPGSGLEKPNLGQSHDIADEATIQLFERPSNRPNVLPTKAEASSTHASSRAKNQIGHERQSEVHRSNSGQAFKESG